MKEVRERVQNGPVLPNQQVTEVTEGSAQAGSPAVTIVAMRRRQSWCIPLAALLACLFVAAPGWADEHPNFSGQWKLNLDQSNFGPVGKPDSAGYRIQHNGANLQLDYTVDGKTVHAEVTTDGQEQVTDSTPDYEILTRAYWAGPVLVFEARDKARPAHESRGYKWTSRWNLSDDGKTLAILKHFTTPQGEFDQKLVFEKQ